MSEIEKQQKILIYAPQESTTNGFNNGPSIQHSAEDFANQLALRAQQDLKIPVVSTHVVDRSYICKSMDKFQQDLSSADFAVIVISGEQGNLLDLIFPRLLVLLTFHPHWRQKMMLVSLGKPVGFNIFDPSILLNQPIIYARSSANYWTEETEAWNTLFNIIKRMLMMYKCFRPSFDLYYLNKCEK